MAEPKSDGAAPDEEFAVMATCNIYGPGLRTGLTWGDLRRLAAATPAPGGDPRG